MVRLCVFDFIMLMDAFEQSFVFIPVLSQIDVVVEEEPGLIGASF